MQIRQSSESINRSRQQPYLKIIPPSSHNQKPRQLSYFSRFSGIIRGQWRRQNGHLQSICYGTAIALSKRIILTCAHSVYLQKKRKLCDSVSFIPHHDRGRLPRNQKIYSSAKENFIKLELIDQNQTYAKMPIPQDLALIYLSEDLQFDFFPEVGVDSESQLQMGQQILISGFPSMNFYTESNLRQINFQRTTLQGTLLQIAQNTIYHNLQTSTGHSGSGILGRNSKTDQITVLGVHTHKGKKRNSGIYLNSYLLRRLAKYQLQFGLKHRSYDLSINFPERIKEEMFMNLSQQQRQTLSTRNTFYEKINQRAQEQQIYDEYDNSEMIFSAGDAGYLEKDEDDEQLALLIRQQQEQVIENLKKDEEIIEQQKDNRKMRQKLLSQFSTMNKSNQQLFYRWSQIQYTFLQIFTKLEESNHIYASNSNSINIDLITFCTKIQSQLQQIKQKVKSMEKIQVIHMKIASVTEHMSHLFAQQMNEDEEQLYRDFQLQMQNANNFPSLFQERLKITQSCSSEYIETIGKNQETKEDDSKCQVRNFIS